MSHEELVYALSKAYQVIWELNKKNEKLLVDMENLSHVLNTSTEKGKIRSFAHGIRDFLRVVRGRKTL